MNTRGSLHFMISEFVILTILWVGFRHYFCNFGDKNFQRSLFFLPFLPFTKVYFHFTRIFWKYRHILNVYASQTMYVYKIWLFWPPTTLSLRFLWYKCLQKVDFFDHLHPSSCKRSLWTAPYRKNLFLKVVKKFKNETAFKILAL